MRRLPPVTPQLPARVLRRLTASRISAAAGDISKEIQAANTDGARTIIRFADGAAASDTDFGRPFAGEARTDGWSLSRQLEGDHQRPPVILPSLLNNALSARRLSGQTAETHASAIDGDDTPPLAAPAAVGAEAAYTTRDAQPTSSPTSLLLGEHVKLDPDDPPQAENAVAFRPAEETMVDDPEKADNAPLSVYRDEPPAGDNAGKLLNLAITDPFSLRQPVEGFQQGQEISRKAGSAVVPAAEIETLVSAAPSIVSRDIEQPAPFRTAQNQRGSETILAPQSPLRTQSEPITLHLKNVDIRQVLEMLSREHGLNILVAPGVAGAVTANLIAVDRDEALAAILKLCHLVAVREGSLTYVYSPAELPMADAVVQIFPLDYSKGADVLESVTELLSKSGKAFLSESDEMDNRKVKEVIVVVDHPQAQNRIAQFIAEIDLPPAQVLIEAHVLAVELKEGFRHGINYERLFKLGDTDFEFNVTGFADPTASPGVFGHLSGDDVDTLLECLKTTTDAKVLASPRVMVLNEQKARIQIGEQLGYKVVTVTEVAAVEEVKFLDVGVVLEVTPRITRDGRVLMRVKPEVSSGLINPETLLPEEDTTEVETNVFLENGEAVVIGGLIQEKDSKSRSLIPLLGELRFVGKLFRQTVIDRERREIIVTLVPRIVEPAGCQDIRDTINVEQSVTPLFEGPLVPHPRPWEPAFPDSVRLLGRHCGGRLCGQKNCHCRCRDCQPIAPAAGAADHDDAIHELNTADQTEPMPASGPDSVE